jgi:hypothetical protein
MEEDASPVIPDRMMTHTAVRFRGKDFAMVINKIS